MANSFMYKEQQIKVGDMVDLTYKFVEGDKQRQQLFQGIVLKVKGHTPENRMITVRKISRSGIGIERIVPLMSSYIVDLKLIKKSNYDKAKLYFVRNLSEQQLRTKLYQTKTVKHANKKVVKHNAKPAQPKDRKTG